jgi:hypothetical protein
MLRYLQLLATGTLLAALGPVACGSDDAPPLASPPTSLPPGGGFFGVAGSPSVMCGGAGLVAGPMEDVSPRLTAAVVQADPPPPPISGGTLIVSKNGAKLVAADPDRDSIYVVDLATRALERRIALHAGAEPGRLVEDAAGRIHVALRSGRGIATFGLSSSDEPRYSSLCDLPRGLAYDATDDHLYVACAEGKLIRVDPNTGAAQLKVELGRDLRDVVLHDGGLFVTRFRASQLIQIDPKSGTVMATRTPPSSKRFVSATPVTSFGCAQPGLPTAPAVQSHPDVAWRAIDVPNLGIAMLHQRAEDGEVRTSPGGYGGGAVSCAPGIVRGAITVSTGPTGSATVDLSASGLFVDLALDPTGTMLALANPAGWGTSSSIEVFDVPRPSTVSPTASAATDTTCAPIVRSLQADGQVTAVAWMPNGVLVAQTREPATIVFYGPGSSGSPATQLLDLHQPSREDSGHSMFHLTAAAGIACASCHPEGGDDGHTWTFAGIGARRTQTLRGGILGTAPFHWNGDMRDFPMLVNEVFVKRMAGPAPDAERATLLAQWIDHQPALRATPPDPSAADRGEVLFDSAELGCTNCHSGEHFTNNQSEFVGTGAVLQVPSLVGVSFRAPFLHDGCAKTLADRFDVCGGGESHGHTAQLTEPQRNDLAAFLESL